MFIQKALLTPNKYSRPQTPLTKVNGVVVHYVGNTSSTAINNRNYFESLKNTGKTYASSHYIIGLQGEIIQCVPENEIAYCSNDRNSDTISIENCHPKADGKFSEDTYKSLIWLLADICKRYKLNPLKDIIRHYDVNKKKCPLFYVNKPNDWIKLREDVKMKMEEKKTIVTTGDEALKYLAEIGIINSPDYWQHLIGKINYFESLLVSFVNKYKEKS